MPLCPALLINFLLVKSVKYRDRHERNAAQLLNVNLVTFLCQLLWFIKKRSENIALLFQTISLL